MTAEPSLRVAERIRFLSCAMGIAFLLGWGAWFWPLDDLLDRKGTPLGADFSMFYVAGQVVADGDSDQLYNQAEHQRRLHELFPGLASSFCLPYRYPPMVASLMAPLARLPYSVAWCVFTAASGAALGLSVALLARWTKVSSPGWRSPAIWACIGWPVALEVLIGGQASHFGLLIAVTSILLLRNQRPLAAGAVLALSAYKPNLLALFAVGVAVRYPRVVLGAIPVLLVLAGLNCCDGPARLVEYGNLTAQLASGPWDVETPFQKVHSLSTWLELAAPGRGKMLALLIGFGASAWIGIWWRLQDHRQDFARPQNAAAAAGIVPVALLLVVNALFNPYTPIYDLVLLAAAAWLAAIPLTGENGEPARISPGAGQVLLAGLFFGPHLSQALARPLGIQLFPLILVVVALVASGRLGVLSRARGGVDLLAFRRRLSADCEERASLG